MRGFRKLSGCAANKISPRRSFPGRIVWYPIQFDLEQHVLKTTLEVICFEGILKISKFAINLQN